MSTDYYPVPFKPIPLTKFMKVLDKNGLAIYRKKKTDTAFAVTDGQNYLWCYGDGKNIQSFTRFGGNDPSDILGVLEYALKIEFIDEHDISEMSDDELREMGFDNWISDDEEEDDEDE